MPFVQAKCPECGGVLAVDNSKKAAVCQFCGEAFIVQEAINHYNTYNTYNTTNQYGDGAVVNIYESSNKNFVIEAGVLKKYHGESVDVVLPPNIKSIDKNCFSGLPIETIDIGNNQICHPNDILFDNPFVALYGCKSLRSVVAADDNAQYSSENGILYNSDKTEILLIPELAIKGDSFNINDSVQRVSSEAYHSLNSLSHLYYGSFDLMNLLCKEYEIINFAKSAGLPYKITHEFVDNECVYCNTYNECDEICECFEIGCVLFKIYFLSAEKVVVNCSYIEGRTHFKCFWQDDIQSELIKKFLNVKTMILSQLDMYKRDRYGKKELDGYCNPFPYLDQVFLCFVNVKKIIIQNDTGLMVDNKYVSYLDKLLEPWCYCEEIIFNDAAKINIEKQNEILQIVRKNIRRRDGKCQYCGGDFNLPKSTFFRSVKCKSCGKGKDYYFPNSDSEKRYIEIKELSKHIM